MDRSHLRHLAGARAAEARAMLDAGRRSGARDPVGYAVGCAPEGVHPRPRRGRGGELPGQEVLRRPGRAMIRPGEQVFGGIGIDDAYIDPSPLPATA